MQNFIDTDNQYFLSVVEPFCRFDRQKIHSVFIKETAVAKKRKRRVLFSSFTRTACLSSCLWGKAQVYPEGQAQGHDMGVMLAELEGRSTFGKGI